MADPLTVECSDCAMPAGTTCSVGAIFRNGETPEPDSPVPAHANRQRLADLRDLDHGVCDLCSRPMVRGSIEGSPIDAWHPDETDAAACPDMGDPKTDWDRYATNINLGVLPGHPGVEHFRELPENLLKEGRVLASRRDGLTVRDAARGISEALNASYAPGTDPELILWRRLTKVSEEAGEVQDALRGYVGENPRKGFTHTREDVITELLDCAGAALGGIAHLTDDDSGLARLADRLVFVLGRLT